MGFIYLILSPSESERKKIIAKTLSSLLNFVTFSYEIGEIAIEEVCARLQTPDLLAETVVVILEKCELLKKEEVALLQEFLNKASLKSYLILSGSSLKTRLQSKEMITYDYSNEKPWDRQRRLKEWLFEEVKKTGKKITPEVVEMLLGETAHDFAQLQQEIFKLVCFVGEKPQIELNDAKKILCCSQTFTGWQIAESLVWGKGDLKEESLDLSHIGPIRYQLQLGEEISSLLEKGCSSQEILSAMPSLKPKTLEKYLPQVRQKERDFFSKGLTALFELELVCKNSSVSPHLLWTRFRALLCL